MREIEKWANWQTTKQIRAPQEEAKKKRVWLEFVGL
jgi:hypothetical protein